MKRLGRSPRNFKSRQLPSAGALLLIVIYVTTVIGCSYYKVNTIDPLSNEAIIEQVKRKKKYIILHYEEEAWHLKDITLDDASQELKGTLEALPPNHMYYKTAKGEKKANRYKSAKEWQDRPVYEVHIYLSSLPATEDAKVSIPFSSMSKVQVYDTHVGATVLSVAGTVIGIAAAVGIIIAALKSSCPFVYTQDGESYSFQGEMFGGAIYSSLERDDYMPLPGFTPTTDGYRLIIANELLERQYINLANLIVVYHPNDAQVILDKNGNIQTITHAETPVLAMSNTNIDFLGHIRSKDSVSYLFDELMPGDDAVSSITLTFKRPQHSTSAKLIVNARNSYWLDYVYGKFTEQFGIYFNEFCKEQKKVPAKKNIQWTLDQNIPLSVYIQTSKGWEFVDFFHSMGPLASRDLVMPIDLSKINSNEVKIKLECGFKFWEVDYVSLDFSDNIPVKVQHLISTSAIDKKGIDVSESIAASDDKYLIQPEIGNAVTIKYRATEPATEDKQSVFLHSRGYYEYIRNYTNWPDFAYLKSFKNKGAFTRFSKEQYDAFVGTKELLSAALHQPGVSDN
jgi:hypothetical protein